MKGKIFWLGLLPAMLVLAWQADRAVLHGGLYWSFTLLNIALLVVMRVAPVSWFYSFLAGFYVLGCWFKVMVHHIADYPYVEPAGNFSGSGAEWQEYYLFAGAMGAAILLARLLTVPFASSKPVAEADFSYRAGPVGTGEWLGLIGAAFLFYIVNNLFAFFVTGVNTKLSLPFGLNAPLAFMALVGVAVVLAAYVARDVQANGCLRPGVALAVLVVTATASVSMASRAAIVMQAVPMLMGAYYLQSRWQRVRLSKAPVLLFAIFVLVVLVAVSIYRVRVFSGAGAGDTEMMSFFLLESALLVVDRWVGAEAIMVAVSEPTRSLEMFWRLMAENPAIGADSIYQLLSGGKYELLNGLTFLTLPGYFGVIGLQGQVLAIFALVMLMVFLGLAYERLMNWLLLGQVVPVALICASIANALTQLSFPMLLPPFLFQMTALAALLGVYMRRSMGLQQTQCAQDFPSDGGVGASHGTPA